MSARIIIDRTDAARWTATFTNDPINLIDNQMLDELSALVDQMETDPSLRVVVFRSANPDFFLAHADVTSDFHKIMDKSFDAQGLQFYARILVRLSRVPVATIAEIDGRARGAGSEVVLACDMRFGSLEGAVLGHFEVAVGAVPGGNPMARMASIMGRGRTMEAILGAADFDGATAERYGYINRAMPRTDLRAFVDNISRRIAGFDKAAIARAKLFVDQVTLPPDSVFSQALDAFAELFSRPIGQERLTALLKDGLQKHSNTEMNLGQAVGKLSSANSST
jgi:enoyl-CoA hydratase/carnithine racemase